MEPGNKAFETLFDDFLEEYWQVYPFKATASGVHKQDDRIGSLRIESIEAFLQREKYYLAEIQKLISPGNLSDDNQIDLEIFKGYLTAEIEGYKLDDSYRRNPSIYISIALSSCFILWIRNFAPKEERYRFLISRLKCVPDLLNDGKENLRLAETIPSVWPDLARQMITAGQKFFSKIILEVSEEIPELKNDFLAAATLASKAFVDYDNFITDELSKKPEGSFAAGREYYELLLKNLHMLPYTPEEIERIGLEYIDKTITEIKHVSEQIKPGADWIDVIEKIKSDTPKPDAILKHYHDESVSLRKFILNNNIVSIPENESLDIIETPEFYRPQLPYGAYMMPAPFEKDQRGFFFVTPIDESASEEKKRDQLKGHSLPAIKIVALHEGYPGHHLQLCHANRVRSKIRRLFRTSVFAEGWALYCEEMMKEQGYYDDIRIDLIQLKDQLWRACRVVIDVRMHTGKYSFDEAVRMLVETARIEPTNAKKEVVRYTQSPTQPMSYLLGKIELMKLMADLAKSGQNWDLRQIHDKLLSVGTIPVSMVRRAILGTNQETFC